MKAGAIAEDVHAQPLGFPLVYRRHYHDVLRWTRALGGPDMDLEDLTQDVFVVVHRQLAQFDGRNLHAWLYTITARTVSVRRRSAWFRRLFTRPRDVVLEAVHDGARDPLARLEQKEAQRRFFALAGAVHASRREAFLLFEIAGHSGEEIAGMQGIPVATVWTRLHLARKEFMAALAAHRTKEEP